MGTGWEMDQAASHKRARQARTNRAVYWAARIPLEVFLKLYFRASKLGLEQIPRSGPAIIASNHRSFFDPFVIGTMSRRPVYYVAKSELFRNPVLAWFLSALGAFPVERGVGDRDAIRTATELLARGELVLIFPEGTRTRPGPLGSPKRGVGRLALESGVPVIPVSIIGTQDIRKGILLRPCKVRVSAGAPLEFTREAQSSPELAESVTAEVWQAVTVLWESLGGAPAIENLEQPDLARVA
jgi:glycerol-3-phosphate dehydrogenase (NAD(P)+)